LLILPNPRQDFFFGPLKGCTQLRDALGRLWVLCPIELLDGQRGSLKGLDFREDLLLEFKVEGQALLSGFVVATGFQYAKVLAEAVALLLNCCLKSPKKLNPLLFVTFGNDRKPPVSTGNVKATLTASLHGSTVDDLSPRPSQLAHEPTHVFQGRAILIHVTVHQLIVEEAVEAVERRCDLSALLEVETYGELSNDILGFDDGVADLVVLSRAGVEQLGCLVNLTDGFIIQHDDHFSAAGSLD
jgi:hypothetical protein